MAGTRSRATPMCAVPRLDPYPRSSDSARCAPGHAFTRILAHPGHRRPWPRPNHALLDALLDGSAAQGPPPLGQAAAGGRGHGASWHHRARRDGRTASARRRARRLARPHRPNGCLGHFHGEAVPYICRQARKRTAWPRQRALITRGSCPALCVCCARTFLPNPPAESDAAAPEPAAGSKRARVDGDKQERPPGPSWDADMSSSTSGQSSMSV